MKKLFIVANWKSHKNTTDCYLWFQRISGIKLHKGEIGHKEVIVCPPFTSLQQAKQAIADEALPLKLGAQDISPFPQGSFTGEVNGLQLREFVQYVIVGHSERRSHFSETDDLLVQKVQAAYQFTLIPIFCVQDEKTPVPQNVSLVAYEPVAAIGTGRADNPQNADTVGRIIKDTHPSVQYILYGGSVTSFNVGSFTQLPHIDGVLVGGASLDPLEFLEIIKHA